MTAPRQSTGPVDRLAGLLRSAAAPGRRVAVVGGFRSGTNYVRYLLEANYRCAVRFHHYGWKHGGVPVGNRLRRTAGLRAPVVGVVRDPYAFLVSLHRYRVEVGHNIDAPEAWGRFLESPVTIFDADRSRSAQYRFASPAHYWVFITWNVVFLPKETLRSATLRYEDIVADPQAEIGRAANALGLRRRGGAFLTPSGKMRRTAGAHLRVEDQQADGAGFKVSSPQSAREQAYTPAQRELVASQLDRELLAATRYPYGDAE